MQIKNIIKIAVGVLVFLLIPLTLTLINPTAHVNGGNGGGWDWSPFDFVWAFVVLFSAGFMLNFLLSKAKGDLAYKLGASIGVITSLFLVWVNAAVGIIGENNIFNVMYLGVVLIGILGIALSRFEAKGMMRTAFSMALAQFIIPFVALIISPEVLEEPPGIVRLFILNSMFAMAFVLSGVIFRNVDYLNSRSYKKSA